MILIKLLFILLSALAVFNTDKAIEKSYQNSSVVLTTLEDVPVYHVQKLKDSIKIDADWDKEQWRETKALEIKSIMGEIPKFIPSTEVKLRYDEENIYVIFRVKDQYVQCLVQDYNGPVYKDSCVEFFFSPDQALPLNYFNVEINCGGTILTHYVSSPSKKHVPLEVEDLKKIEIAHSLPKVVDSEIKEPVTWFIEYKIPLTLLSKYANVSRPKSGVVWKANFYKTASTTSNPHYLTWSYVNHPKPNFHLPEFFGTLIFL